MLSQRIDYLLVLISSIVGTVYQCHGACAEVDSDTEAVAGKGFKLGCISCKRRSEVEGSATVEWYFRAKGEADFVRVSPHQLGSTSHIRDIRLFLCHSLSSVQNALGSTALCSAEGSEVVMGWISLGYFTPQGPKKGAGCLRLLC